VVLYWPRRNAKSAKKRACAGIDAARNGEFWTWRRFSTAMPKFITVKAKVKQTRLMVCWLGGRKPPPRRSAKLLPIPHPAVVWPIRQIRGFHFPREKKIAALCVRRSRKSRRNDISLASTTIASITFWFRLAGLILHEHQNPRVIKLGFSSVQQDTPFPTDHFFSSSSIPLPIASPICM